MSMSNYSLKDDFSVRFTLIELKDNYRFYWHLNKDLEKEARVHYSEFLIYPWKERVAVIDEPKIYEENNKLAWKANLIRKNLVFLFPEAVKSRLNNGKRNGVSLVRPFENLDEKLRRSFIKNRGLLID
jgi:hypothetical protein